MEAFQFTKEMFEGREQLPECISPPLPERECCNEVDGCFRVVTIAGSDMEVNINDWIVEDSALEPRMSGWYVLSPEKFDQIHNSTKQLRRRK